MREILFRGKKNGKWVYGVPFILTPDSVFIEQPYSHPPYCRTENTFGIYGSV